MADYWRCPHCHEKIMINHETGITTVERFSECDSCKKEMKADEGHNLTVVVQPRRYDDKVTAMNFLCSTCYGTYLHKLAELLHVEVNA